MKVGIFEGYDGKKICACDKNLTDLTACVAIADKFFPKRWVSKQDVEMNDTLLGKVNSAISSMDFEQAVDHVRNIYDNKID